MISSKNSGALLSIYERTAIREVVRLIEGSALPVVSRLYASFETKYSSCLYTSFSVSLPNHNNNVLCA